jgi:hypothetical protein
MPAALLKRNSARKDGGPNCAQIHALLEYSLRAAQTLPVLPLRTTVDTTLRATFRASQARGRMDTWMLALKHWENVDS